MTQPPAPTPGPEPTPPAPSAPAAAIPERTVNPVALNAAPPARGRSSVAPWVLVGLLTAVVLVLVTLLSVQGQPAAPAAAPTAAATATSTDPANPAAAASPDAQTLALMRSLPRRQADDPTALGPVDAPAVMIVWSDYRCPFCAQWANTTFKELLPYVKSGSLRVEARDLVLFGEESTLAAVAARAAGEQGKFWEFHDVLFAAAPADGGHPTITKADVVGFAKKAGVPDLDKFTKDLSSKALADAVEADTAQAQKLGISGTPFFLIDTTVINGAQPAAAFVTAIEAAGGHK